MMENVHMWHLPNNPFIPILFTDGEKTENETEKPKGTKISEIVINACLRSYWDHNR